MSNVVIEKIDRKYHLKSITLEDFELPKYEDPFFENNMLGLDFDLYTMGLLKVRFENCEICLEILDKNYVKASTTYKLVSYINKDYKKKNETH